MPCAARWKCLEVVMTLRGTTPSATTRAAAVDVGQERLERGDPLPHAALDRLLQLSSSMTRGRMSSGKGCSSPPTSKVTPWSR